MSFDLAILALLIGVSAIAAITLRDLVHCVLCLAVTFASLAAVYLRLGAEFLAFSQVLVYVGAVAILALFVVLLTRTGEPRAESRFSPQVMIPLAVCAFVFTGLAAAAWSSSLKDSPEAVGASMKLKDVGRELMTSYVLPLEVLGLLLTAALIGAAILAKADDGEDDEVTDLGESQGQQQRPMVATTHSDPKHD